MNTRPADALKFPAISLILGILSGFATAIAARFWSGLNPFVGIVFGTAVVVLVWLKCKRCSAWLVTALLATSVASYGAATWGTLYISGTVERLLGRESSFTDLFGPGMFSIAGFVGALIFNLALFLLLSPKRGLWILGMAAAWAAAGAFLGFISAELAESVGRAVAAVVGIPRTDMGSNDYYLSLYSAYLIWQTGMCLLIPLMEPGSSVAESGGLVSTFRSPAESSISRKLFFSCILAAVAAVGYISVRDLYRTWKYQDPTARAQAMLQREIPSAMNLPPVERKPLEQMLILHAIGHYIETASSSRVIPAYTVNIGPRAKPQTFAERVEYRIGYEKSGSTSPTTSPEITVVLLEFPNPEWARYQLKAGPAYDGQLLYPRSTQESRFGSPVLICPAGASAGPMSQRGQYVYWQSDNKVVVLYHLVQEAAEETIRQYLAKYPSSL